MKCTMELFGDKSTCTIHDYLEHCEGLFRLGTDNRVFECVEHDTLAVGILPITKRRSMDGNLMEDMASIQVLRESDLGRDPLLLTWKEARQLCAALWQITNIAEFG